MATNSINILVKDSKSGKGPKRPLMGNPDTNTYKLFHNSTPSLNESFKNIERREDIAPLQEHQPGEEKRYRIPGWIILILGIAIGSHLNQYRYSHQSFQEQRNLLHVTSTRLHDAKLYTPEQIHLSMGKNSSEVYVTWATMEPTTSFLMYCKASDGRTCTNIRRVEAEREAANIIETDQKWIRDSGKSNRTLITYRARMENLEVSAVADVIYLYKVVTNPYGVESCRKRSHEFSSKTYRYFARNLSDTSRELRMALYGDLGLVNGKSIDRLIKDVDNNKYDAIIHNGDFAYDLDTQLGQVGDEFMRKIEPIAARVLYQTSVGNHEVKQNFTHYNHRFTMINSGGSTPIRRNNFYYSFNMGPVHFVSISTEFYYFLSSAGLDPLYHQYEWLKKDLEFANKPTERARRPWIIVFGHRPMYCSSRDGDDCSKDSNILRRGLPFAGTFALEKLFYEYGVDVELYSHEHQYERFLPIYNGTVMNGTTDPNDPYQNPEAPVHIISGSAGCQERIDPFNDKPATGSIKQISDYGYTRLTATRCGLRFEQVSDDQSGTIVDEVTITKSSQNFPIKQEWTHDCGLEPVAMA